MSADETRDLARDIAQECLARRIRQVGRVVSGVYERELRPTGVTISQFNLLVALACGLTTAKALGDRLQLEKSTVSRNLERMAGLGWVEGRAGEDGRSVALRLTPAGRGRLRAAHPAWKRAQAAAHDVLGPEVLKHLEGLMKAFPP
jgi:DNA-binding MarR family transcriptional regulator